MAGQQEADLTSFKFVQVDLTDEIRDKCRQLCDEHLAGAWSNLKPDEIEIETVEGGLCNRIYLCINKRIEQNGEANVSKNNSSPSKVLIRFYGSEFVGDRGDMIIVPQIALPAMRSILYYNGLAAKIYAIYEEGLIEEYIEHRKFTPETWSDENVVKTVMRKMADIHSLEMPISKKPWSLFDLTVKFYNRFCADGSNMSLDLYKPEHRPLVQRLLDFDVLGELEWIKSWVPFVRSPIVFSHNDLHFGNIFERLDRETLEERVFIIDYDNSGYGFRGFDLAFFLIMKSFIPSQIDTWKYRYQPDRKEKRDLLQAYLDRYIELHDQIDPEIDNLDHLELEADFFSLLLNCVWNSASLCKINPAMMSIVELMSDKFEEAEQIRIETKEKLSKMFEKMVNKS